jgi:putative spermidine/putrescine transport system substrate-binding protein
VNKLRAHPAWVPVLIIGALALAMLAIAGCGDDDDDGGGGDTTAALSEVGPGEGELNIICWAGYCEDGTITKGIDWVTPFEQETGCQTNVKIGDTSDQMVDLMRTGQYDGVSASGNATARLVEGGDVDPVNVDLVPNYETIFDDIKDQPYNTFDGTNYGIPHGRGADLLMWRTDQVKPDPTSWSVILDPNEAQKYSGKISVYDDPIYIADAAVYLKAHNPDLGIEDPYELDENQFNAAVDLLKQQHPFVGDYWSSYLKQINLFTSGDDAVGTTWQYMYFTLLAEDVPVKAPGAEQGFVPEEGATGWSDTWMLSSEAKHPNCMYRWMNYVTGADVQAQIMQWFGEAPAQSTACDPATVEAADKKLDLPPDPKFCDSYHAADPAFWDRVYYWKTPLADCGDDRGSVCKDYNDWVAAWTEIKG